MSTLVQVAGAIHLDNLAAAGYLTALRDVRHDGLDLFIYQPAGGLRSVEQIKAMQKAYDLPRGTTTRARALAAWGMDPNSRARPSTNSPHVSGLCADIGGSGFGWMVTHGRRYGWRRTLVAQGDLPHFEFFPTEVTVPLTVTTLTGLAGGPATPIEPTIQEQIMARDILYVKGSNNPAVMALNTRTGLRRNVGSAEFAAVNASGKPNYGSTPTGDLVVIAQATLDALKYEPSA